MKQTKEDEIVEAVMEKPRKEWGIKPFVKNQSLWWEEPIREAIRLTADDMKRFIEKMRKGAFSYSDLDGATPDIIFSRGYNKAIDELKLSFKEWLGEGEKK